MNKVYYHPGLDVILLTTDNTYLRHSEKICLIYGYTDDLIYIGKL